MAVADGVAQWWADGHHWEVLGTMQVGASPPIFPMLRKPR
jgi:hypothetical protein